MKKSIPISFRPAKYEPHVDRARGPAYKALSGSSFIVLCTACHHLGRPRDDDPVAPEVQIVTKGGSFFVTVKAR